jgi:hypothetical protein
MEMGAVRRLPFFIYIEPITVQKYLHRFKRTRIFAGLEKMFFSSFLFYFNRIIARQKELCVS